MPDMLRMPAHLRSNNCKDDCISGRQEHPLDCMSADNSPRKSSYFRLYIPDQSHAPFSRQVQMQRTCDEVPEISAAECPAVP